MQIRKTIIGCAFLCSTFLGNLAAQNTGSLIGTVMGTDSHPLPSASVNVSGPSGVSQNTVTDSNGKFSVSNLAPGSYRLEIRATGYRTLSQGNVTVNTGAPVELNINMLQGNPVETVQVQGQPVEV